MTMYDDREIHCPKLGGQVTFGYCRREGGDIPCPRIIYCWHPFLPVEEYLKERLSSDQWDRCFGRQPQGRIERIFETVERLKKSP